MILKYRKVHKNHDFSDFSWISIFDQMHIQAKTETKNSRNSPSRNDRVLLSPYFQFSDLFL